MATRTQSPRNAPRGPAPNRRGRGGIRKGDRDGDVSMDISVKGRGRIGKPTPPPNSRDTTSRGGRGGRAGILSEQARSAILRKAAAGDVSMKEARPTAPKGGLVDLNIAGWENSKASSDADGGVSSLIKWMEKKASHRLGSRTREVRIKKSRRDGTILIISVASEDVGALVRMDGYGWAGTKVSIQRADGTTTGSKDPATEDTKAMLRRVLENRYNFDTKFLDLSALEKDEELNKHNIFAQTSTAHKAVRAMMKVLELSFDTEAERHAAITSVSLANNRFVDLTDVKDLSLTLPKLLNLDLSNNNFPNLEALQVWRRRFYNLQHLILSGNPIEQNEPNYPAEIVKWYPNLRMLNNVQVRTEEDITNKLKAPELPFPIKSALFQDEGGIVENFVRTFFNGFDTDRAGLAAHYYDERSDFSFAVNTQAPRDPAATQQTEKQEWDHYIKNSRNLKKISHLPARQNRHFRGPKAVAEIFAALPKTKHPDLASEARKWMIEAHIQPGVPDPTGQSPNGVDGFMIVVHGEFDEVDTATGQATKKRSFDRTFIIGPGGPSGVRIVNDMLTIRAYGGAQAFEPENFEGWSAETQQTNDLDAAPQLPAGVSLQMAEQMVAELSKRTSMTMQYSKLCLEQVAWNFDKALVAFANVKANLPADAFVQPA